MKRPVACACALRCAAAAALLVCFAAAAAGAENGPAPALTVVQWNVENLFDAEDDADNEGDDEFTAGGWQCWTEGRYALKLAHLAEVLDRLGGDIVCLEEIENRRVLEDLAAALRERHGRDYPCIVHREGTDQRGIDVAVLSRLRPRATRWLTPVPGQRDVLVAEFAAHGRPFTLIVNHWKSGWGPKAEAARIRAAEARAVRAEIDRVLAADPSAAVLLAGDFNVDFDDALVADVVRSVGDRKRVLAEPETGWLYNLHAGLDEKARGTIYYRRDGAWNSFDTISVSRGMLPEAAAVAAAAWALREGSYEVFRPESIVDGAGRPLPFRMLADAQTKRRTYCTGYSDHLPVRVVIEPRR